MPEAAITGQASAAGAAGTKSRQGRRAECCIVSGACAGVFGKSRAMGTCPEIPENLGVFYE